MSWSDGEDVTSYPPAFTEELLQFLYLTPVGVVKFRLDGSVDLINPAAAALLLPLSGESGLENLFLTLRPLVTDVDRRVAAFSAPDGTVIDQQWLSAKKGVATVLSLTVIRVGPDAYMAVLSDVTRIAEQDRALLADRNELRKLATVDSLTGAFNRRQGDVLILAEFARQARDHRPFSLLLLDIDHFKSVNDRFGHATGDQVLRTLTRVCARVLRTVDMVVRWGGDEFLVLLPGADAAAASRAAERVRSALAAASAPISSGGRARFTVSIGGAQSAGDDVGDLIRRADQALYAAKAAGRDQAHMAS